VAQALREAVEVRDALVVLVAEAAEDCKAVVEAAPEAVREVVKVPVAHDVAESVALTLAVLQGVPEGVAETVGLLLGLKVALSVQEALKVDTLEKEKVGVPEAEPLPPAAVAEDCAEDEALADCVAVAQLLVVAVAVLHTV
jgi:hypothetical protein